MPTGDAYSSGHLVPSHLGLAYVLLVETNPFSERVVIFLHCALRTSLGTFSILLSEGIVIPVFYGDLVHELSGKTKGFAPQFRTKVASDFEGKKVGAYGLVYEYFILIEC